MWRIHSFACFKSYERTCELVACLSKNFLQLIPLHVSMFFFIIFFPFFLLVVWITDMNETTKNATNATSSSNETSTLSTLTSSITTQPLTHHPSDNKTTQSTPPTKGKSKKFKRKRVNFHNGTKRRTKRPYHYQKIPAWSAKLHSTVAVNTKPTLIITHCSAQECRKWRACWHDVKRSHKCACDEVTCSRGRKGSAHARAGNDKDTRLTGTWEGLFLRGIALELRQRVFAKLKLDL